MPVTYQSSYVWHVQVQHDGSTATAYVVVAQSAGRAENVAVQAATDEGFLNPVCVGSNRGQPVYV